MKTTLATTFFLSLTSIPAFADSPTEVPWKDFCRVAGDRQLDIVTSSGENISGYCAVITVDEVSIRTPKGIVKLGRAALTHISMERSKGRQISSLGHSIRSSLKQGTDWLLSPAAPLGIVTIPGTLAWGAVAAPFCLLGDLKHHLMGSEEIALK